MKSPLYQPNTQDVLLERAGRVATITLSRPEDENRLTPDALAKLEVLAAELARDEEIQAVLITGSGERHFSMGILPPALRRSLSKDDVVSIVRLANRAFN